MRNESPIFEAMNAKLLADRELEDLREESPIFVEVSK